MKDCQFGVSPVINYSDSDSEQSRTIRSPYDGGLKKDFVLTSEAENHLTGILQVDGQLADSFSLQVRTLGGSMHMLHKAC